jgi:hypothetical protein
MSINSEILNKLVTILGKEYVFIDDETRNSYSHDETEDFVFRQALS